MPEVDPSHSAQHYRNLAVHLHQQKKLDEAVLNYQIALSKDPADAACHYALGYALSEQHRYEPAIASFQRALALRPNFFQAVNELANAWRDSGNLTEATRCFIRLVELVPGLPQAHYNLARVLQDQGRFNEAIPPLQQALRLKPDYYDAHFDLGSVHMQLCDPDSALECFDHAAAVIPGDLGAMGSRGNALKDMGRLDEAIDTFRQCQAQHPDSLTAASNLLMSLLYHPGSTPQSLFSAVQRWADLHEKPRARLLQPHQKNPSPDRRLRIGYVSPDFREHPIGRFVLALLAEHNHTDFEIYCYSEVAAPDALTAAFRDRADHWRDIRRISDEHVTELVRQDQIDILVDLALHLRDNRLLVFAMKPAPVQVTFAGYPGTTGLTAIDYRLSDPYLDPPALFDTYYSEQTVRLPDTFWCDPLLSGEPAANELPAATDGCITFGSLNNFCKINDPVLSVWARVLNSVAHSRLLLLAPRGVARQRVLERLAAQGIVPDRISFVANQPRDDYLRTYHRIDIGLDPWPYGGHSTSFDALWMGVPLVTLVGSTIVGRAGLSQLTNLGMTDLIAYDQNQYVKIATDLANDLPRLAELRRTLRERMRKSPLTDGPKFARGVENAYRMMWKRWCQTHG